MNSSAELRIPTVSVPVRLALVGHEVMPAELFLRDHPRSGRSELLDEIAQMIEGSATFVPVRFATGVRLLSKHAVVWVAIRRREAEVKPSTDFSSEEPSEVFTLYDRQHHVEVLLISGTRLSGTLLDSSPADRPRVVDHLNRSGAFVRLWTPDEHYVINKTQIVSVTELEGG